MCVSLVRNFEFFFVSGDPDHVTNDHDQTHAIGSGHIDATKIENDPETKYNRKYTANTYIYYLNLRKIFRMNDTAGDISTEEFSDVSQDKEELIIKKENEKIEQIQEYKNKLERLERDDLDELKRVSLS